jgi:hypothetical protein
MLKVIYRSLILMLLIAMVAVGLYALIQNPSAGASLGGRAFSRQAAPGAAVSGTTAAQTYNPDRFREGWEGRFSFSLAGGLSGVLGNSILLALITLAVFQLRKAMAPRILRVRPVSIDQT